MMAPRGGTSHSIIILMEKQSIGVESVDLHFLLKDLQNICFPVAFHLTLLMFFLKKGSNAIGKSTQTKKRLQRNECE